MDLTIKTINDAKRFAANFQQKGRQMVRQIPRQMMRQISIFADTFAVTFVAANDAAKNKLMVCVNNIGYFYYLCSQNNT